MKLKKVKLYNIRSYVNEEIVFPEGSTLLWGNIGSGKSSILLAIDFALFGLQRGNLTGGSMLRNGTETGYVELCLEIEGKEIIILRALRRSKNGVLQDAGFIIRDGVKEEKTALELKEAVLTLFNYPKELLTKNKSLIFRYTVYTPQEEMKQILLSSIEERLDILRKVFGVDKYKRVKDNSKLIATKLRELKRIYEASSTGMQEKVLMKDIKQKEKIELEEKLKEEEPKVLLFQQELSKKKREVELVEKKKDEVQQMEKEVAVCREELRHLLEFKIKDKENLEKLEKEVEELEKESLVLDLTILEKIKQLDESAKNKEREIRTVLNKIQELKTRIMHSDHIGSKVEKLSNCPTCFQEVLPEYKDKVLEKSKNEIKEFEEELKLQEDKRMFLEEEQKSMKEGLELLKKKESELLLIKLKLKNREEKKEELNKLKNKEDNVKDRVSNLNLKILELEDILNQIRVVVEIYPEMKEQLERLNDKLRKAELEKGRIESALKPLNEMISELERDIEKMNRMRAKLEYLNKVVFWLTDSFMPLMDSIEKNILFKVHSEFNSLFENWFSILMDNENLKMSLDEEYTPKILQNGYDIEYEFLSGGEKTAGALAYRLALNQVINNLNAGLKTNDLLILDEPTDGFSQDQLERLQVVMEEIKIPQIILVSHEPKIESFVDHTIRLEKQGYETKVL